MLTVQMITKNNQKTLRRALESLDPLECRVVVADMGSSDSTLDICSDHGAEIIRVRQEGDRSAIRNGIMGEGMNMILEPWEFLAKGHEEISACETNSNVLVVNSNFASKELRIWKDIMFKNPVYESLDGEAGLLEGVAIVSKDEPDRREENAAACEKWRESRPTDSDPWYYSAFSSLSLGRVDDFMKFAERYLAMAGKFGPAEVQMSYRMAQTLLARGDLKRSAGICLRCMALHPSFSEFWCLMGDIFMRGREYSKARSMYVNALEIGSRRSSSDSHPVEMEKYMKYPAYRIRMLEEMDKHTGVIKKMNH